ncbi:MAG: hypothetical protein J1E34_00935 [Oscillospiraceae bacterium]|nr:hypothetical protein [Oscillospiraceae bacterium]
MPEIGNSAQKWLTDLYERFELNHIILYIGQDASGEEIESVAGLPWACVITSQSADIHKYFNAGDFREAFYSEKEQLLFNKKKLPIFRIGEKTGDRINWRKSSNIMNSLPDRLSLQNCLVIIGYNPDKEDYPYNNLQDILQDIPYSNVQIWGMNKDCSEYENLKAFSENKQHEIAFSEKKLSEALDWYETINEEISEGDGYFDVDTSSDFFFVDGKPIEFNPQDLFRYENIATLLSREEVYKINPNVLQEHLYMRFLEGTSSDKPQWYGYISTPTFHIKRYYEDEVFYYVQKMLNGKKALKPIILFGPPGSSKSVTIASVAYRVFAEKKHPVLYIKNGDASLSNESSAEFKELSKMIEYIVNKCSNVSLLVVWDCSSYKSVSDNAVNLFMNLQNLGRKVVLLCSAYIDEKMNMPKADCKDAVNFFEFDSNNKPGRIYNSDNYDIADFSNPGYVYIRARRDMRGDEKSELIQKFRQYTSINDDWDTRLRLFEEDKNIDANDISDYFYILINILRNSMNEGLAREQYIGDDFVSNEIHNIIDKFNPPNVFNPFEELLDAFGIDPEEIKKKNKDDKKYDIDSLNLCVALLGKFKLEMPSHIASALICPDSDLITREKICSAIARSIPWIDYYQSSDGNYVLRYRNAREAELYLQRNDDSEQTKQRNCIEKLVEIFKNRLYDEKLAESLLELFRLVGPNSRYDKYRNKDNNPFNTHWETFCRYIKKIADEFKNYKIKDYKFALLYITYTREIYGYNDKVDSAEDCNARLEKMKDIFKYAVDIDNSLKEQYESSYHKVNSISKDLNNAAVEIANCFYSIKSLTEKLKELGCECDNDISEQIYQFGSIYERLAEAIKRDSRNGYSYIALFKAFKVAYEAEKDEQQRMKYACEVMDIADHCWDIGPENISNRGSNGSDSLSGWITTVTNMTKTPVTLDDLINRKNCNPDSPAKKFYELFDAMCSSNNPAAITYICRNEVGTILSKEVITNGEKEICKKVMDFMNEKDNYRCVETNKYAIAFLIKITWLYYNGRPLASKTGQTEWRQTCIKEKEGWEKISKLCDDYKKASGEFNSPIILLLGVLAGIQLGVSLDEAEKIRRDIVDKDFMYSNRMFVPFMICDEKGEPKKYSGEVKRDKNNLYIKINGSHVLAHFYNPNMDKELQEGECPEGFGLGIGYTKFAAHSVGLWKRRNGK